MKFAIFPGFGALNSGPIFQSFKKGAEFLGHNVTEHNLDADVFVIWSVLWNGRMAQNQEIWKIAKNSGKKILILEVGGLIRGKTWRVGLNHINNLGFFGNKENLDLARSKKLGIFLKDWRKHGENILICGQHTKSEQWITREPPEVWLKNLVTKIKTHTDRKIVFRPHPRDSMWCRNIENLGITLKIPEKIPNSYDGFDHDVDFQQAWCVINPSSTPAVTAAIDGIPVFCDQDSLAWPVSIQNLRNIDMPREPERTLWLEKLCHTEWTIEEIEHGIPLSRIFDKKVDFS